MMLKCESCLSRFQQASDLFQHIQSSCLLFYKNNPQHWAQILSKMTGPVPSAEKDPSESGSSEVQAEEVNELPVEDEPSKSNASKKEPPFCIMFKAQKVRKGQPAKNLHMTVSDYYYGVVPAKRVESKKITRMCKCSDCGKSLRNNIRFMSHLRHKILNRREKKEVADARNICNHCFREYSSPFLLECHLENVHGTVASTSTCKICDVHFPTDRELLCHMKVLHVQNEAPYSCKLCSFRSSICSDITRHFREEHADTTGLMCPFCLHVCFTTNAFSKHVLQHSKKGFACSRCRLIFNSTQERVSHQDIDHVSQNMKEKMIKFKNSHLCQIYVRVAPYKDDERDSFFMPGLNGSVDRTPSHTKVLKRPSTDVPVYMCPTKRSNCVRKIRIPDNMSLVDLKCMECDENLGENSTDLRDHFRYQFECKWCVHVTSCEHASHDHVLREHADSEMREELFGKTETEGTTFPIILQDDDNDVTLSKIKEEPPEFLPATSGYWEYGDEGAVENSGLKVSTKREPEPLESSQPTKARRKQPNPMKIPDASKPSPAPKWPRKDRYVQTRGLEQEKAVQACDADFKNLHGNADRNGNPNRRRKTLAQPGYFPRIDDDAGWAKYFASIGKDSTSGKSLKNPVNPSNAALPTMVPRQGTYSILNKALQSHRTGTAFTSNDTGPTNSIDQKLDQDKTKLSNLLSTGAVSGELSSQINNLLRRTPQPPSNLRCLEVTHDNMLVQWEPPPNGAVTQYRIVFQGVGPPTSQILPSQQTLVKLVGLKPDVMYAVRVFTIFYTGKSDYAYVFEKTLPAPAVNAAPSDITITTTKCTNATDTSSHDKKISTHHATSVATTVMDYRPNTISTYLALKSAAVGSSINSTPSSGSKAIGSTMTASVQNSSKVLSMKQKNESAGNTMSIRCSPLISTSVAISTLARRDCISHVASVSTVSNFRKPVATAVLSTQTTKSNTKPPLESSIAQSSREDAGAKNLKDDDDVVFLVFDGNESRDIPTTHLKMKSSTKYCSENKRMDAPSSTCQDVVDDDVILVLDDIADSTIPSGDALSLDIEGESLQKSETGEEATQKIGSDNMLPVTSAGIKTDTELTSMSKDVVSQNNSDTDTVELGMSIKIPDKPSNTVSGLGGQCESVIEETKQATCAGQEVDKTNDMPVIDSLSQQKASEVLLVDLGQTIDCKAVNEVVDNDGEKEGSHSDESVKMPMSPVSSSEMANYSIEDSDLIDSNQGCASEEKKDGSAKLINISQGHLSSISEYDKIDDQADNTTEEDNTCEDHVVASNDDASSKLISNSQGDVSSISEYDKIDDQADKTTEEGNSCEDHVIAARIDDDIKEEKTPPMVMDSPHQTDGKVTATLKMDMHTATDTPQIPDSSALQDVHARSCDTHVEKTCSNVDASTIPKLDEIPKALNSTSSPVESSDRMVFENKSEITGLAAALVDDSLESLMHLEGADFSLAPSQHERSTEVLDAGANDDLSALHGIDVMKPEMTLDDLDLNELLDGKDVPWP